MREALRDVMDLWAEAGASDIDPFEVQLILTKHGLVVEVEASESCGKGCTCYAEAAFPTTCLRPSSTLTGDYRADPPCPALDNL